MPKRDEAPIGAPCWVDLMTSDPEKSRAFYGDLFGWTWEDPGPDYGGYFNFVKDGEMIAGGMRNPGDLPFDVWSVYLAVKDARETTDAAVANGGTVMVPAMEVQALGTMGVVTDPSGATIGLWQPGEHRGMGIVREPGTPAWFELHTTDYPAAVSFYEKVFHWPLHTMGDTDEFRYTTYGDADNQEAGIMDASSFLPDGVPSHWSIYFAVDKTDAALARIVELGGQVVTKAEDTPYGRLATATDVTGAMFKLVADQN